MDVVKELPGRHDVLLLDVDYGNFHEQTWGILMGILSAICNFIGPFNKYKVLDIDEVIKYIKIRKDEDITVSIGLLEDWYCTNDIVFTKGRIVPNASPQITSTWATPIFDVNGQKIAAWKYSSKPLRWREDFKRFCDDEENSRLF